VSHKSFEQIIDELRVPNHDFFELIPGKTNIPENLLPYFKRLFRPAGVSKSVGNGEVAMYWLLDRKYGGIYDVASQSGGGAGLADFLVDGVPVEIKGWNQDLSQGDKIKVGRFERSHKLRRMINIIFGAYNVFMSGRVGEKYGKDSYLSEISFGMNGLTRAFDCALRVKDVKLGYLDNLREVLSMPCYEGIDEPSDYAAKTFAMLARKKLANKIGPGNFIVNVRPDKIGQIEAIQLGALTVEEIDLDIIKDGGACVRCAELFVNLLAFRRKND